jgi:hypothetical protein
VEVDFSQSAFLSFLELKPGRKGDEALIGHVPIRTQLTWCQKEGKDIYCYFDNDQRGYAVRNALELQEMVRR